MKKKLFAILTAMACCTGMTALPVRAEDAAAAVTNDELEALLQAKNTVWTEFISANGYADESAYALLKWGAHTVELLVKTPEIYEKAAAFIESGIVDENTVEAVLAPEYEYEVKIGGANEIGEVNGIVASEYFGIKDYLTEQEILSNIYLAYVPDSTYPDLCADCVEVQVKDEAAADTLKVYLTDNAYWQDVVHITVVPELSAPPVSLVHHRAYVVKSGDANDDGQFGVADAVKLQKYLLTADTMTERQGAAADLTGDGIVDVYDLALMKRALLSAQR